jgi:hypothetical protein
VLEAVLQEVLCAALRLGGCSLPVGFPRFVRATLEWLVGQFFRCQQFSQRLFEWIQFRESRLERSLVECVYFIEQSQFRRVGFA